jgi:catechol 2,3-dioxygenase-like lactoylglutathione lyase family enzyme
MRFQLALNVNDLEAAIAFYSQALGTGVNKREPGYANFVLDDPALKLVLFESTDSVERLNHMGFEVFSDHDVEVAATRLDAAQVRNEVQNAQVCCYARQNKVIAHDPQGLMLEWYRVLEDSPTFFAEAPEQATGCC